MNLKRTCVGLAAAVLFSAASISGAFAQSSTDVHVKVVGPQNATLSAVISAAQFTDVPYRAGGSYQNSTGNLVVTASDTRGVGSGWTVSLAANGDFHDNGRTFSVNGFQLQAGSTAGRDNASVNGINAQAIGGVTTSPQSILVAQKNAGMGVFDDTIVGTIRVPDGTLVGQYETTLTVSIVASN